MSRNMVLAMSLSLFFSMMACGSMDAESDALTSEPQPTGKADEFVNTGEPIDYESFREGVYCEPDSSICIVEGDIPISEQNLKSYYKDVVAGSRTALTAHREKQMDVRWSRQQRFSLTYCVTERLGDREERTVEALKKATTDWEQHAHVRFEYRPRQDSDCHPGNSSVLFAVTSAPEAGAPYMARAFFPNQKPDEQRIRINWNQIDNAIKDRKTSDYKFSFVGVLRHELGHILGFRHEHTRPEAGAKFCQEQDPYRPVTDYDPNSVMHYPQCNGENDFRLPLSDKDKRGASFYYPNFEDYPSGRCDRELLDDGTVNRRCEPVVHQLITFANKGDKDVLDEHVGLDERAVESIIEVRRDDPFVSLAGMKERIPYFEEHGVTKLYKYLYVKGRCETELTEEGKVEPECRPIQNRILKLVNTASKQKLDDEIRLDSRAAENIVEARQTSPFRSVARLWMLNYVKEQAFRKMHDYITED